MVVACSVNALGVFMGEGRPDFLPISDHHPCRPVSASGISERLVEVLCAALPARTGVATICLRPLAVLDDSALAARRAEHRADPAAEFRRGGAEHDGEHRLPLVDDRRGGTLLGWAPRRRWAG